jgi:hypothetical protein
LNFFNHQKGTVKTFIKNGSIVKPQSSQRNTLRPQKEFPLTEALYRIYEAQVLTYLRALDKRLGLLVNFNVVRLKEGIQRLVV